MVAYLYALAADSRAGFTFGKLKALPSSINLWKHKDGETADSQNDRYIFGEVRLDNYIIGFESEILFKQIMHLTEKQREVLLKNVVLDIPMEKIAQQMKIQENKVYKHKKNALSALAKRIKPDEI